MKRQSCEARGDTLMKKFEVTIFVGNQPIAASLLFDKNASSCR
jgi:hypothetical protein